MRRGFASLLMLTCLAFYASGIGGYAHERLEHWHDGEAFESVAAGIGQQSPADHHNHDDCPVCQMLAGLTATPATAPVLVCGPLLSLGLNLPVNQLAEHFIGTGCASARGPPVGAHV